MQARGLGLIAALAVLGFVGGYVIADRTSTSPAPSGVPTPVAATGPAVPTTPAEPTDPDSDLPPLAVDAPTRIATFGKPPTGLRFPIPKGWDHHLSFDNTQVIYTLPGDPEAAYSVRINPLQVAQSPAQMVAARVAQLPLDSRITQLKFLSQTDDTLVFTYILNRHRIEQVIRWVSVNGGPAIAEIAASGRLVDDPGMKALTAVIASQTRRLPPDFKTEESPSGTASPAQ